MDALPTLLLGGRLVGSSRVEGGWAGREVRVHLKQPRANGGVQLEVAMRVGGKAFLRACRVEEDGQGPPAWSLSQGEDDPPADAATLTLWERLRTSGAFGAIDALQDQARVGESPLPKDALTTAEALELRHEVFVGRMLRWESGRALPASRVPELLRAALPALEAFALDVERVESGKA